MADRSIRVRLIAEIKSYLDGLKEAGRAAKDFGKDVSGAGEAAAADIEKVGHTALATSAVMAAGFALSVKAAVDWESAWAGVQKTVDGTTAELDELEAGLRDMASSLPATHGEIAAVAEAAGALGIQTSAIEGFTRTMVDLGETTNLTADQAANAFARIANIMQTPQTEFDRMGSTVVDLGNNLAATESEITEMALRVAGAGRQIGLTEDEVLSFAGALSSVGLEAEAGGSAISRTFIRIDQAVREGGERLEAFAATAGMTAEEFTAAYRDDAAGAIATFIEGLGEISAAGGNVFGVLEQLGLSEIRVRDALLRAAGAGDLFREALQLGSAAWEENSALTDEAALRYDTVAAQLEVLRNRVTDLAIDVGDRLLPVLSSGADSAGAFVTGFQEMPGALQGVATGLGVVVTGGLGVIGIVGTLAPKFKALQASLMGMGAAGQFAGRNLGKIGGGLAAAGVAIAVYSVILGNQAKKQAEAEAAAAAYTQAIRDQGDAVGDLTTALAGSELLEGELGEVLRGLGVDLDILTDATQESQDALDGLDNSFNTLVQNPDALSSMARNLGVDLSGLNHEAQNLAVALEQAGLAGSPLADELMRLASSGEVSTSQMSQLLDRLGDQGVAFATGAREAENLAAAEEAAGTAAEESTPSHEAFTRAVEEEAEAHEELLKAIKDVIDARRAAIDPLFAMLDAFAANREAISAEAEAIAEGQAAIADAAEDLAEAEASLSEARARAGETIADAERSLADARASGDIDRIARAEENLADARAEGNASGIAAAEERLADARERLDEVSADAVITAEEWSEMNQAAAESAADVEAASIALTAAIEDGTVSVEGAQRMLQSWVEQGLITQATADELAVRFQGAADAAEAYAGDYVAHLFIETNEAEEKLASVQRTLDRLQARADLGVLIAGGNQPIYRGEGGWVPGTGSGDTVPALLTPGEFVVRAEAAERLGPAVLAGLNSGSFAMLAGGGYAGSTLGPGSTGGGGFSDAGIIGALDRLGSAPGGPQLTQQFYGPTDASKAGRVGFREMRRLQLLASP